MAKCEKRQVVVAPPPNEYVLTLSEVEANVLKSILGQFHYSGSTHPIYKALDNAGAKTIGAVVRLASPEIHIGTLKLSTDKEF